MAVITTNGTVIRQYNAFTGLSALERSQSGVARAEVVYYNVNDAWPAPGVGNKRVYQIPTTSLPKDFGYVLTDVFIKLESVGNNEIPAEAAGLLRIFPGGSLGPQINVEVISNPSRQDASNTTTLSSGSAYNTTKIGQSGVMVYRLSAKPTPIIYPFGSQTYSSTPNPASQFDIQLAEEVVNGTEYDVTSYIRFLQYDIDQSYNYVIQSPQITR